MTIGYNLKNCGRGVVHGINSSNNVVTPNCGAHLRVEIDCPGEERVNIAPLQLRVRL